MQTKYITKLAHLMGTTESKSDPEKSGSIVIKCSVVIKCSDSIYFLGFYSVPFLSFSPPPRKIMRIRYICLRVCMTLNN